GPRAPGARPEGGVNPITALGALRREVPALEKQLGRLCRKSRHLKPPTVTPTIVHGPPRGVGAPQSNVIPALAEMTLDVRLTPGLDAEGMRGELEALCRKAEAAVPGAKLEWE